MFDLGDLSFDLDLGEKEDKKEEPVEQKAIAVSHRLGHRHLSRKAASEKALEEALDWHFEEGDCYHCFSFGDVDALSYFKHVLKQQKVKYLALSSWCISGEDINDLKKWHEKGLIGRVDFFVGEIFTGSYPEAWDLMVEFAKEEKGKVVVFRNHAKFMIIVGDRFDCLIESSANVNTNPRSENTVLTVNKELVKDYVKLFSEIVPFNRDFEQPEAFVYE